MAESSKYNVVVVGATGNVGQVILNILAERNFPIDRIYITASRASLGKKVSFGDKELVIQPIEDIDFKNIHIVFGCAGSDISKILIDKVTNSGAIVIDKSSLFRMNKDVPLIVPEVNSKEIIHGVKGRIIAAPNCIVIPIVTALKPLDNFNRIKRVVISTYQSTSGAGREGMDELHDQTKGKYVQQPVQSRVFTHQIAFNIIPQIGDIHDDGYSEEEVKITQEITKVMGRHIHSTATCVRVPVFVGHAISLNIEFENKINAAEVRGILSEADGISVEMHRDDKCGVTTPIDAVGEDAIYISRIRDDLSQANTVNMWIVVDNLRKGAALNSVQIAEKVIELI